MSVSEKVVISMGRQHSGGFIKLMGNELEAMGMYMMVNSQSCDNISIYSQSYKPYINIPL